MFHGAGAFPVRDRDGARTVPAARSAGAAVAAVTWAVSAMGMPFG